MVEKRNRDDNAVLHDAVREVSGMKSSARLVPVDYDPFAAKEDASEAAIGKALVKALSGSSSKGNAEIIAELKAIRSALEKRLPLPASKDNELVDELKAIQSAIDKRPTDNTAVIKQLKAIEAALEKRPAAPTIDFAGLTAIMEKQNALLIALASEVEAQKHELHKPTKRKRVQMGRNEHGQLIAVIDEVADSAARH
jgi:hypothetical protein